MGKQAILKNDRYKFIKQGQGSSFLTSGQGLNLNPYSGNGLFLRKNSGKGLYLNPYNPKSGEALQTSGEAFDFSALSNLINTGVNFAKSNADTIKNVTSAVSNSASAISKISDAVKQSKELDKIRMLKEIQNKRADEALTKKRELPESVKNKLKSGDGLKLI